MLEFKHFIPESEVKWPKRTDYPSLELEKVHYINFTMSEMEITRFNMIIEKVETRIIIRELNNLYIDILTNIENDYEDPLIKRVKYFRYDKAFDSYMFRIAILVFKYI